MLLRIPPSPPLLDGDGTVTKDRRNIVKKVANGAFSFPGGKI